MKALCHFLHDNMLPTELNVENITFLDVTNNLDTFGNLYNLRVFQQDCHIPVWFLHIKFHGSNSRFLDDHFCKFCCWNSRPTSRELEEYEIDRGVGYWMARHLKWQFVLLNSHQLQILMDLSFLYLSTSRHTLVKVL